MVEVNEYGAEFVGEVGSGRGVGAGEEVQGFGGEVEGVADAAEFVELALQEFHGWGPLGLGVGCCEGWGWLREKES